MHFALCIRNDGYEASLEVRKIYRTSPDPEADKRSLVRVIDDSGEDYLYPAENFVAVTVPEEVQVTAHGAVVAELIPPRPKRHDVTHPAILRLLLEGKATLGGETHRAAYPPQEKILPDGSALALLDEDRDSR